MRRMDWNTLLFDGPYGTSFGSADSPPHASRVERRPAFPADDDADGPADWEHAWIDLGGEG